MEKELQKCFSAIVELNAAAYELYHEGEDDGKKCANECSLLINKMFECNDKIRVHFERLHQES